MRKILIIMSLMLTFFSFHDQFTREAHTSMINYEKWDQVLNTYVNDNGRVNYDGLKANRAVLDDFIASQIENTDISNLSKNEQKAFWINAYNALTMQLIVDHYPIKFGGGIRSINWGRPWNIKMKVAGQNLTLGDIEHKILRKWNPIDPRIHFAINCASISCPHILNTYFHPDNLDEQLDYAARQFVNDSEKNRIDRSKNIFYHSAILNWFEEDFLSNHSNKLAYILEYLNEKDRKYMLSNKDSIKLKEIKYDWGLNRQ